MKKFIAFAVSMLAFAAAAQAQDVTPPTLDVTSPVSGVAVATDRVTVTGEAGDDVGVAVVEYRVEGKRRWRRATLTNPDETSTSWVFSFKHTKKGRAIRFYVRVRDAEKNESDTIGRRIFRAR
jgi:opacity protein-like surface antigen